MRTGRPIPPPTLTAEERETLEHWIRRAKTGQALAQRCRLVIGCAAGKSNSVVAAGEGLCAHTAGKWRTRFLEQRLDGLLDEPRPAAPGKITECFPWPTGSYE